MASEITATASLRSQFPATPAAGQNPEVFQDISLTVTTFTKAATGGVQNTFSVPTTAGGTAIPMGSVTTSGWAKIVNLDVTNYVQLGSVPVATFVPFTRLMPGEFFEGPVDQSIVLFGLANTGAVKIQYEIFQR